MFLDDDNDDDSDDRKYWKILLKYNVEKWYKNESEK